jgi:shikimate kinase
MAVPSSAFALPAGAGGLALVGYRGSGKTSVGRLLGALSGRSFVDVDTEIERCTGRGIAAVFAQDGEPVFRDLEEQALRRVLAANPAAVVATGGGAVLRDSNRSALGRFGIVVWLDAPAEVLADRLAADPAGRPALTPHGLVAEVAAVLETRRPLYRETADLVISVAGRGVEAIAREIFSAWADWTGRDTSRAAAAGFER